MPDYLYFAANLSTATLSLPDPPPAALWVKPRGVGAKLTAMHLLTAETYARILYQVEKAGKAEQCRELMRPLRAWADENFHLAAMEAAYERLVSAGGPRVPLPQPDPMGALPTPFDDDVSDGVIPRGHWEGVKFVRDS